MKFFRQNKINREIKAELAKLSTLHNRIEELIAYEKLSLLSLHKGMDIKSISRSVFENYPKATGFLKDVQRCNLQLMCDFKKFCEELNIKFWLHAGTLIGALRNNGFVQWDDDVDVAMTRADFELLRTALEHSKQLTCCEYYNEVTCSRQYQLKYKKEDIPVFIDIAVYDKCSTGNPEEQNVFWKRYRKIYKDLLQDFVKKLKSPQIVNVGYHAVGLYTGIIKEAVDNLINNAVNMTAEKNLTLADKPSYFYSIQNYPFSYPIMKWEDLYPLQEVPFEGQFFYTPNNAELYLWGYGNIWLPPKDIGKNPHLYAFEKYKEAIENFLKDSKVGDD